MITYYEMFYLGHFGGPLMLIKNQIYETTITDYTSEGQGVAHVEGCAVFIPNAIAGER